MQWLTQAGGALGILLFIAAIAVVALLMALLISLWIRAIRNTRAERTRQKKDDHIRSQLREAGYTAEEVAAALEESR